MSPVNRPGDASGEASPDAAPAPSDVRLTRVLLVDDHRLILDALTRMLSLQPDIVVIGSASSVAETRGMLDGPVDVALVDYRLRDGTGVDAIRAIKAAHPECRIVMLTAHDDEAIVFETIQAGADGYLTKDRAVDEVVATVRAAHAGATLLPRSVIVAIARRVAEGRDKEPERTPGDGLTPRELEVLRALTEGLATPEVCERMGISPNTLRTHVQNIMGKLGVHSKLEAVAYGLRNRLVEPPRPD